MIDKQLVALDHLIEGLGNGVLLLTRDGKKIYGNSEAERICQTLDQNTCSSSLVPEQVWHICRKLMKGQKSCPDYSRVIVSEIHLDKWRNFRVRAKWLAGQDNPDPYLVVTIENEYQSLQNQAIFEADQYGLTPAETRVWELRRTHHTREEIAVKLYITVNTVKKHLKNIKNKLDDIFYEENWM